MFIFLWLCKYHFLLSQVVYFHYISFHNFALLSGGKQQVYPRNFSHTLYWPLNTKLSACPTSDNLSGQSFLRRLPSWTPASCSVWTGCLVCSIPIILDISLHLAPVHLLCPDLYVTSLIFQQVSEKRCRCEDLYPNIMADCVGIEFWAENHFLLEFWRYCPSIFWYPLLLYLLWSFPHVCFVFSSVFKLLSLDF